jgi:DNA invertase Pin-like site-specific DNA recombinase
LSTYALYARRSSESEDRQVLSIESQLKELRAFARQRGLRVAEVYTESRSARAPGRPAFGRLLEAVASHRAAGILTWKLDRLARNPVDGAALIWALDQGQLAEITTPQRAYQNRGDDKLWMQLEFGMAKKYVDDLSDNVKRGNRAKLERGWLPGLAPPGYRNDREAKTIVPDRDRFPLVRRMWDLLLSGTRPAEILKRATKEWGYRTPRRHRIGGNPLARNSFYKVFSNPFYYGLIARKGDAYRGSHKPMVSKAEFDEAQRILGRATRQKPKTHEFSYTGLIHCGHCGGAITAQENVNRYGTKYIYYHCSYRKRHRDCREKSLEERQLEAQVSSFLGQLTIPDRFFQWAIRRGFELAQEEQQHLGNTHASITVALVDSERRLDKVTDLHVRELIDEREFLERRRRLLEEQVTLKSRLQKSAPDLSWFKPFLHTLIFTKEASKRFRHMAKAEKHQILDTVGSNLVLKDKILRIEAKKPFRVAAEGPQNPTWWAKKDNIQTFFSEVGPSLRFPGWVEGKVRQVLSQYNRSLKSRKGGRMFQR